MMRQLKICILCGNERTLDLLDPRVPAAGPEPVVTFSAAI